MKAKIFTTEELAKITNNEFRRMESKMDKGFAELTGAIKKLTEGIDELRESVFGLKESVNGLRQGTEDNFRHVHARLERIEDGVSDVPTIREEINDLEQRMARIERKVGVSR